MGVFINRLDLMILEIFSNLIGFMILFIMWKVQLSVDQVLLPCLLLYSITYTGQFTLEIWLEM